MKYKKQKPVVAALVVSAKDTSPSTLGNEASPLTSIVAAFAGSTCIKNVDKKMRKGCESRSSFVNSNE